MAVKLNEFIDRFKAMEKVANETLAADPKALAGVDSMPGSEHDAKVPEEAKKPDALVAEGQPAGATSAEGAVNGGDAKILNEGKLEMDQPLLNPEKKPLITDDALTAKVANDQLAGLVKDLLADLNTEKQAQCGGGAAPAAKPAPAAAPAKKEEKKDEGKDGKGGEKKASPENVIKLDDETIAKLAAAQVAFANGRAAAEKVIKQASAKNDSKITKETAIALIKAACVKEAQAQGLDPAAAEAAVNNAMMTAGVAPDAAAAEGAGVAAADAGAAEADAAAASADAGAASAEIPDDVTEEELATALVDLVSSGEIDPEAAKALVEEIAGDQGAAGPTEDQAAEIIAQGLEDGQITPEQAQQIAAAVEGGDAAAAGEDASAAGAEAQGAADAAAAAQDAADEANGADDAMKAAAAMIRENTINKVASKIVEKRASAKAEAEKKASAKKEEPAKGSAIMAKVAAILKTKVEAKKEAEKKASASEGEDAKYIAGFKKKAEELGFAPSLLAKYVVERQSQAK